MTITALFLLKALHFPHGESSQPIWVWPPSIPWHRSCRSHLASFAYLRNCCVPSHYVLKIITSYMSFMYLLISDKKKGYFKISYFTLARKKIKYRLLIHWTGIEFWLTNKTYAYFDWDKRRQEGIRSRKKERKASDINLLVTGLENTIQEFQGYM